MGIKCDLQQLFKFIYIADVENNLIEHELDYVFKGHTDAEPVVNPAEVQDYEWISPEILAQKLHDQPELFTAWFRILAGVICHSKKENGTVTSPDPLTS